MDLQVLKNEIDTDPLTRGYGPMSDQAVADSINAVDRTRKVMIDSGSILKWAAGSSAGPPVEQPRILKLEDGEANADDTLKALSKCAMIMLRRGEIEFDLNKADVAGFLSALVPGVLSDEDKTALETVATENISRATEIGLAVVRPGEVAQARAM